MVAARDSVFCDCKGAIACDEIRGVLVHIDERDAECKLVSKGCRRKVVLPAYEQCMECDGKIAKPEAGQPRCLRCRIKRLAWILESEAAEGRNPLGADATDDLRWAVALPDDELAVLVAKLEGGAT